MVVSGIGTNANFAIVCRGDGAYTYFFNKGGFFSKPKLTVRHGKRDSNKYTEEIITIGKHSHLSAISLDNNDLLVISYNADTKKIVAYYNKE